MLQPISQPAQHARRHASKEFGLRTKRAHAAVHLRAREIAHRMAKLKHRRLHARTDCRAAATCMLGQIAQGSLGHTAGLACSVAERSNEITLKARQLIDRLLETLA